MRARSAFSLPSKSLGYGISTPRTTTACYFGGRHGYRFIFEAASTSGFTIDTEGYRQPSGVSSFPQTRTECWQEGGRVHQCNRCTGSDTSQYHNVTL